jgi:hypothetical protein
MVYSIIIVVEDFTVFNSSTKGDAMTDDETRVVDEMREKAKALRDEGWQVLIIWDWPLICLEKMDECIVVQDEGAADILASVPVYVAAESYALVKLVLG